MKNMHELLFITNYSLTKQFDHARIQIWNIEAWRWSHELGLTLILTLALALTLTLAITLTLTKTPDPFRFTPEIFSLSRKNQKTNALHKNVKYLRILARKSQPTGNFIDC